MSVPGSHSDLTTESTASELRKTGISDIGDVRWGTHFCYFYETKQDLLETQVLYFKTGLESKEFCIWVVSQVLSVEEAKHALGQAVPDLERHLAEGALEIHSHDEWYLRDGRLDPQRVLQSWREKLNQTLAKGYAGLRAAGDGGWIQSDDSMVFREYEEQVNALIADQRSIILCTYPLATSPGDQVFDVAHIHQVAVARRNGNWEIIKTRELKQAKAEIKWLNEKLEQWVIERTSELAKTNEELRREIIERRRVEEKLKQSERLLAEAQHLANVGSWSLDLDSYTVTWSDELYRIFGVQPSEFDHRFEAVIGTTHPEDRDWLGSVIENALKTHEPFSVYYRITQPAGEVRVLHARGAVVTDEHGNASRLHGTAQDVTERKQTEEALRESETRFRQVAENINEVFWLADPEATLIHYVSPAYEKIWGRSCDSLYAEPSSWMDSIHPDDRERVAEGVRLQVVRGRHDHTYRIVRPDGSLRWIRDRAFPVSDESGKLIRVAGIAEDITERKEAEEQLKQHTHLLQTFSRRLFEVQEEERRHLARELHDEVGQALTAAKINLQSVTGNGGGANVARLQETTAILDRLLGQVRQISLDLRPSMLDDLGLIPALRSLLDQQGHRASVAVHLSAKNIPEKLDPEIQTTCFRIAQEAITNAVRHAHATQIDLDLRCKNGKLRLLVRDNGIGLDVESAQPQPIGLGLIGIKERAGLVGGRAKIVTAPNKGMTIQVFLPLTFRPAGRDIGK